MPNIALIKELRSHYAASDGCTPSLSRTPSQPDKQLELLYFGSDSGMEKALIAKFDVPYQAILCGKWRRYFSWQNFADIFKIPLGIMQALVALRRFKPHKIFCKGGYVSFPVAIAGWLLKIPVIIHESDLVPGLANKICSRFATKICVAFEESKKYFPHKKVVVTGTPVRPELLSGSKKAGQKFTGFTEALPVLLFMGGSQGAAFINTLVWQHLNPLLSRYQVVHICGENKCKDPHGLYGLLTETNKQYLSRYRAYTFVEAAMKDLYALVDFIITRAGANTLAEIAVTGKPAILIPLGKKASRGDQIDNARAFIKHHSAVVMLEEEFEQGKFFKALTTLKVARQVALEQSRPAAAKKIIQLLESI